MSASVCRSSVHGKRVFHRDSFLKRAAFLLDVPSNYVCPSNRLRQPVVGEPIDLPERRVVPAKQACTPDWLPDVLLPSVETESRSRLIRIRSLSWIYQSPLIPKNKQRASKGD